MVRNELSCSLHPLSKPVPACQPAEPAPLDCLQMPEQIDWEGQRAQIDAAKAAGAAMLRCCCRRLCCHHLQVAVHRCLRTLFCIAAL